MSDIISNEPASTSTFDQLHQLSETDNNSKNCLLKIFGDRSTIEAEEGKWKVSVVLKDAMCPGGQTVVTELERKDYGTKFWFAANELTVDGLSLPDSFKSSFIFIPSPSDAKDSDEKVDMVEHLKNFLGNKGFDNGLIQVSSLKDGDGLASLFHEIGHTKDRTPSIFLELDWHSVSEYVKDKSKNRYKEKDLAVLKQSAQNVLEYEMEAHKIAIAAIDYLRGKGCDMFKGDEDLFRVKNFFVTATMTWFKGVPKFTELVGREKINEIFTFKNNYKFV